VRVVVASDEESPVLDTIVRDLSALGHTVERIAMGAPWPLVGRLAGEAVSSGTAERAVVCCWTGTGVSIAANKVQGVRAALCTDAETASGARRWNDANVLALSLRLCSSPLASEIVAAFFGSSVDPGEAGNVAALEDRGRT
jgi:ribose 5-phosphate isomerase B